MKRAEKKAGTPGTLYVVGTPIGNLEDITLRALRILSEVDWIAAEDTRRTRILLRHHGLEAAPLISYFEHNEQRRTPSLVDRLSKGESGALVTTAGTPTVSDPGYRLVSAAAKAGIPVAPVPGPTAAAAALSASGLATDAFVFLGFCPKKPGQMERFLQKLAAEEKTMIFYESPTRILSLLEAAETVFGDRRGVLAREMTKRHEEFIRGRLSEIRRRLQDRPAVKGECTLLVAGETEAPKPSDAQLTAPVAQLLKEGMSVSEAAKTIAEQYGVPKARVYKMALEMKKSQS
ncbi:MAG: 16S rRNA (cytidine(1402)-2'-O)-methyltransferase [Desulfobacterales bacterium]|nr:16S rRNA (cytidine(1402)-2'-O)-methyltransferase [Desulfobacterales bacterium]